MKRMGWIGLAVLLAVGLTHLANGPAQAQPRDAGGYWGPIELTNVGDEPGAWGEAALTKVVLLFSYIDSEPMESGVLVRSFYTAKLTVKCRGLTPGQLYSTPAGTFRADRKGTGNISGQVDFEIAYWSSGWGMVERFEVGVDRAEADGSGTVVLMGTFAARDF
jgi:hypothetical protein